MSWAARRRLLILLILGAVVTAFLTVVLVATFYETPTCTDGKQNQDETGVDCGGSCAYLCQAGLLSPTVLFTKALQNVEGRTDVIATVENKNVGVAAKNVPYRLTLYGEGQALIQQVTGTLDLPPASSVPIFIPGIVSGKQTVTRAFLDIAAEPNWFSLPQDPRVVPDVSTPTPSNLGSTPRVEALLANPSAMPLRDTRVIILVRSASGEVIAASATLLPVIPAQGQAKATFTWNTAFKETPATFEVVPVIPLPAAAALP